MSHARYLGDAVYAQFDGFGVVLTTDSHVTDYARNIIVLEPEVVAALEQYLIALKASLKAGEKREQI